MTDTKLTELVDLDTLDHPAAPAGVPADRGLRRPPEPPAPEGDLHPRLPPYDIAWSDKP